MKDVTKHGWKIRLPEEVLRPKQTNRRQGLFLPLVFLNFLLPYELFTYFKGLLF